MTAQFISENSKLPKLSQLVIHCCQFYCVDLLAIQSSEYYILILLYVDMNSETV